MSFVSLANSASLLSFSTGIIVASMIVITKNLKRKQMLIMYVHGFQDQVSKAGRPAFASEAFTVSDHLKCGLPHGLLPLAILENITVFGRRASSMASNLVAHAHPCHFHILLI